MTARSWRPVPLRWVGFLRENSSERNVALLTRYVVLLVATVTVFSVAFHVVMGQEGHSYGWWVGPYWAISTMTTLGLGDIVFTSMAGQLLTALVVVIGIVFMLVLLPLVLIQFPPWVEARTAARVRRLLPRDLRGHVLLTSYDSLTAELIHKLARYQHTYAVIVPQLDEAMRLEAEGVEVMLGELDLPETWQRARVEQAALVVASGSDIRNPNAVFTARGASATTPILAVARRPESVGPLELAGCTHVLQLADMLGRSLARRVIGGDALTHEIGRFGDLRIAEATAFRTPLVGKPLRETVLAELRSVAVVGVWERGEFRLAEPDTPIGAHTVLVLAGTRENLAEYDSLFAIYNVSSDPVVVIGGGSVGQATARALKRRGIDYRLVDRKAQILRDERGIQGDAAEIDVLERAGIAKAPAVVITTHDDDMNVFLALYCRQLRPNMQIISRATLERNVETLHRAGTDFVVSLTSMGANAVFNVLEGGEIVTVSEGLNLFKLEVPADLVGTSLAESGMRHDTGCSVVALLLDGQMQVAPDPQEPLPEGADLVLIGSPEAEERFLERFGP